MKTKKSKNALLISKIYRRIHAHCRANGVELKPGDASQCAIGRLAKSVGQRFETLMRDGSSELGLSGPQATAIERGFESSTLRREYCKSGTCSTCDVDRPWNRRYSAFRQLGFRLREEALNARA